MQEFSYVGQNFQAECVCVLGGGGGVINNYEFLSQAQNGTKRAVLPMPYTQIDADYGI